MRISTLLLPLSLVLTASAAAQMTSPPRFLGVEATPNPNLWDVDPLTGDFSNPRAIQSGTEFQFGLAMSDAGLLYGMQTTFFGSRQFYSIDRETGGTTIIATMSNDFFEGDLAFDPTTGILYCINFWPGAPAGLQLMTIDVHTGGSTLIGDTGLPAIGHDFSAMAFDAGGRLWTVDSETETLHELDKSNAAILSSIPLSNPVAHLTKVAGMAFDPYSGDLYYADGITSSGGPPGTGDFITIDTTTGVMTRLGHLGTGVGAVGLSGMTFPTVDVVQLFGPASVVAGSTIDITWEHGPTAYQYGIFGALNPTGSVLGDAIFDLDVFSATLMQAGVTTQSTGLITTPVVPLGLAGSTVYIEMGFRDVGAGLVFDSELVAVDVL